MHQHKSKKGSLKEKKIKRKFKKYEAVKKAKTEKLEKRKVKHQDEIFT